MMTIKNTTILQESNKINFTKRRAKQTKFEHLITKNMQMWRCNCYF